jgi:hypothetical protein
MSEKSFGLVYVLARISFLRPIKIYVTDFLPSLGVDQGTMGQHCSVSSSQSKRALFLQTL